MEELPELAQLGRVIDPGRVEDERLELLAAGAVAVPDLGVGADRSERGAGLVVERRVDLGLGAVEDPGERADQVRARRGAEQHGALDHRLAGLVAVELGRLREPDVLGDQANRSGC